MTTSSINQELLQILNAMKKHQLNSDPASLALRQDRLARSIKLIKENHKSLSQAMSDDFGHRSYYQSLIADMATTIHSLSSSMDQLPRWMKPETVSTPDPEMRAEISRQPLGVVGVISPWNFPINLSFGPLAGIFSGGNSAMLKPSELTPRTSELLAELVGRYFGPEELTVVLGEAEVGKAFSHLPFDHLMFTGSTAVGKHVMKAAAENLVPVTLELGGKSPVMVTTDIDIKTVVERTLTVKTFNAGQICLSPDYVLLPKQLEEEFVQAAKAFISSSFSSIQANPDYTSIISKGHYTRLLSLLQDAEDKGAVIINLASENEPAFDEQSRKIAPHLILNATDDMAIMQQEIFGPLLPIKSYQSETNAIEYINANPRPLAAYYFGEDTVKQNEFAQRTTSGALIINDVMSHASIDALPFGGVGASGMGSYHGIHGFNQFTHAKPIVIQSKEGATGLRLRAPYAEKITTIETLFS